MKNDYVVKKAYQSFVVTSIMSALTATAGMLIDNIIVGQFLGTDSLGAMGIVGPIGLILSMINNIFTSGCSTQAAQALGRGDRDLFRRLFSIAITCIISIGAILTVAGIVFAPQLVTVLGAREDLVAPSIAYLRGYFLGAIPTILLPLLNVFVKIDGSRKLPVTSITVMSVSDIVLDLMMVLVFKQGMFGMALATTISYWLAVAVACTHFLRKYNTIRFVMPKKTMREFTDIVTSGAPTAANRLCTTLQTTTFNNILVTAVGVGAVAALNVRTQAVNIIGAIIMGASQALLPVGGVYYGEQDPSALKGVIRSSLTLGLTLCIPAGVILFLFSPVFARLLGVSDPEILNMASIALRIYAFTMPIQLLNMICIAFYQTTKRRAYATMICIMESFVYVVLAAFVLIRPLGSNGVWLAFLIAEVLTAFTVYIFVSYKNKKPAAGVSDYMLLDPDFGTEGGKRWTLSIGNDMDEVLTLSEQITERGKTSDVDPHTLNTLALCIEEIAGNIVRHAFSPGEKKWFDLMILYKKDSIIVRMRDNGKEFDPLRYLYENKDTDSGKIGLRLISSLSDEFEYRRVIGLNNVIIVVNK